MVFLAVITRADLSRPFFFAFRKWHSFRRCPGIGLLLLDRVEHLKIRKVPSASKLGFTLLLSLSLLVRLDIPS